MDGLFKRSVYTVLDSELYHNAVPNTDFLPEFSMKIVIDPLFHNHFRLMDVSAQIHHQRCCVICYRNGNHSATTYFCENCTVLTPNPSKRVTYKHTYFFSWQCMSINSGNCV